MSPHFGKSSLNEFWYKLFPWKRGDRVRVIAPRSFYHGRTGTCENFFTAYSFEVGVTFDERNSYAYFKKEELERI